MLQQFMIVLPELMITLLAMASQMVAVFCRQSIKWVTHTTVVLAVVIIFFTIKLSANELIAFNNSFVLNPTVGLFKAFVLGFTIAAILLYKNTCKISAESIKMEFITLMLLSTVGIFISISSRNFLLLFCGLELQALSGYALAAFNSSDPKSSEAGLKYFVLGALVTCLMLFGISFLYGFSGGLQYNVTLEMLNSNLKPSIGAIIGATLMLSGIFFKLSAAPMHIWTPDVYEGAPTAAVTYFATAQKIGILVVLLNILTFVIGDYFQISIDLVRIIAMLSMIIGALGAIMQSSLKRLMAYSTVLNIGYVLIGVVLHSEQGNFAALLYLLIYITGVLGFFACLIALLGEKTDSANFEDIRGIGYSKKAIAGAIAIIMFSMIGLPPLAGFFGKYYVFYQAIVKEEFLLAFTGIFTSVIAAFYYLKVIKSMYFTEPIIELEYIPTSGSLLFITCLVIGFILFFSLFPLDYVIPLIS